ncbi:hypothetical protein H072_4549 [Dactylellina haptotyla CBS 200.50]|uniref:Tudor domain-containing protein n=1 Tax=Dactylellina haptotyla (strain CBS 200.50) TaxID=1284197 RepID=S8BPY9_DACHA|nr:hypothetical protein H072_4549 [Dactylellina haptotyla CBS 200.50]
MEAELKEYKLQLESVEAALKGSPDNQELLDLRKELEDIISLTETIAAESNPAPASPVPQAAATNRKRPAEASAEATTTGNGVHPIVTYNVGDQVQARWISGDGALYPARITSVTGSSKNPVYIVAFTGYDNTTETLASKDLRPNSNKKARVSPPAQVQAPTNTAVISQAPTLNPGALEAGKKEKDGDGLGKKAARKVRANKELDESKSKWQAFAAKGVKATKAGKAKKIGEGSMFRTPDGIHGRVGFTGSGQPMRKDVAREKHVYQKTDNDD